MNTKLTLQLNKDAIDMVKLYAKARRTSLPALVENYFRVLAKKNASPRLSPIVEELSGIIELPDTFDLREEHTKHLVEK